MIKAGATPKLITSPKESSSLPTFDTPLNSLAILIHLKHPSSCNDYSDYCYSNFPSNANLIDDKPIQTPISVNIFGRIILVFFRTY